jgi:HK97 family phage prohead protease
MERVTFAATGSMVGNTLQGVAHAFGQRALVGQRYVEFAQGAFDSALRKSDVRAFVNHNTDMLLGREKAGTVRLSAEPDGLHYAIDLPATSYAEDMKALIARGDLNEMSFGVFPGKYKMSRAEDGKQVMTHTSVSELFDISPVSLPAFGGTSVELHSRAFDGETAASQAVKARHRALER